MKPDIHRDRSHPPASDNLFGVMVGLEDIPFSRRPTAMRSIARAYREVFSDAGVAPPTWVDDLVGWAAYYDRHIDD